MRRRAQWNNRDEKEKESVVDTESTTFIESEIHMQNMTSPQPMERVTSSGRKEEEYQPSSADELASGSWPPALIASLGSLGVQATEIRRQYQRKLFKEKKIRDTDFNRSLSENETCLVHNSMMNDVKAWMSPKCLK